jgi:hypothetical protein
MVQNRGLARRNQEMNRRRLSHSAFPAQICKPQQRLSQNRVSDILLTPFRTGEQKMLGVSQTQSGAQILSGERVRPIRRLML